MKLSRSVFYLFLLISSTASSEQLRFSKQDIDDHYQFNYTWLDLENNEQSLSFSLDKKALFSRFRNFKTYKAKFAQQYVNKKLQKELIETPLSKVQVSFRKDGSGAEIKGRDQKAVNAAYAKLIKMEQAISAQYLAKNYYHKFTTYDQVEGIKPDHVKIAKASVEDLKPIKKLILSKVSIKNIRKVTDFSLSFIQSIPYSTLESRATSSGAGFSPPLKLLWENQGDCDSKVTLTAALLRTLMPRVNMIMVFIDQHALMGINVPAKAGETTLIFEGGNYVLAEPTGPALYPLGEISPESKLAIDNNHFSIEKF